MIRISEKGKRKEGRGLGDEANYKPYIQAREFSSVGTCSNPIDWKTGRSVELLSQGEAAFWHILRWADTVCEIKEQYPLELLHTVALAEKYNIKHPHNSNTRMTTDFFVSFYDGRQKAFSLKNSRALLTQPRTVEKLFLEKVYWAEENVPFQLVFKEDLNVILTQNIRMVVEYYSEKAVHDDASVLKHLIATKKIQLDMQSEILNIRELLVSYSKEVTQWKISR